MSRTEDAILNNIFSNSRNRGITTYKDGEIVRPSSGGTTGWDQGGLVSQEPIQHQGLPDGSDSLFRTSPYEGESVEVADTTGLSRTDEARLNNIFSQEGSRSNEARINNVLTPETSQVGPDRYAALRRFRNNIDFEDKESIKELQGILGVEQDGMFGPKTEKAWRLAVSGMDKKDAVDAGATPARAEEEALRYDWNDAALNKRMRDSKFKLGGKLRQAWTNLDENVFGGNLPGGYRKDISNMTAEEYYDKKDKPKSSSRLFKGLFGKKASDADVGEKY